ncbi:MAG: MFS transporter, partial [Erysipelotrichales bacterium]|nr:MFS transporter [Erysipelotrichales bacterium]
VTLILVCIVGYFAVCIYALFLHTLLDFAILAFGVGCFQGSIQSLSRSYYSKIIPAENSGEYFGIYDIFSKGASFLGSAVIAWVKLAGGSINIAVALLSIFFALGFLFLKLSDKQKKLG